MSHGEDSLYPIRAVSNMTGVNAATLRAWERRYGLIEPSRTPKGHRLYSAADIARIQRIVELLDQGMPPSQVGAVLDAPSEGALGAGLPGWSALRRRLLDAVRRFDEPAVFDIYREALANHPFDDVTESLTVPTLQSLGDRWQTGKGRVAEEHFFHHYVRNALGSQLFHRHGRPSGPMLVTACLPGEEHDIGLLLFNLSAESAGFRVVSLGANTPLDDLPHVVEMTRARAVVLSTSCTSVEGKVAANLRKLGATLTVPVLVGGRQSEIDRDRIERAGAITLGEHIRTAVRELHGVLGRGQ